MRRSSRKGVVLHEDVQPAVVEALEDLSDAGRAAHVLQGIVREPDDPELALLFEALPIISL